MATSLIIWHTTAIVFMGPWHRGGIVYDTLRPFYTHYLDIFALTNGWRFYVYPTNYEFLRYELETPDSLHNHERYLDEAIDWDKGTAYRYSSSYDELSYNPRFVKTFAGFLCRQHSDLEPSSVTVRRYMQYSITREMYLAGARPYQDGNFELVFEETHRCLKEGI